MATPKKLHPMNLFRGIADRPVLRTCLYVLVVLAISALQAIQLNFSCVTKLMSFFRLTVFRMALSVLILVWLNLAAKVLFQKWHIALYVTAGLATAWSIVNVFVLKFHGSPLFFSEFANFSTAMNVVEGYRFVWDSKLTILLLLGVIQALGATLLLLCRRRGLRFFRLRDLGLSLLGFAAVSGLLWLSLFVWEKPKPRNTISWTWVEGVSAYGYVPIIVEDVDRSIHYLVLPEGYSADKLDGVEVPSDPGVPPVLPDIILIVNESYYDLSEYLTFTTDVDYMEGFYGIENATYGKAVIPNLCGGTNNTEYELLTSHSMHLLTRFAPFNYVNMNRDDANAARYLKALGYSSAALHCEPGSNYSRNRAYPNMGFDRVIMGNSNFTCRNYGNRRILDEDNFRDLISVGESMQDGPRLLYLLTFQNHGGWNSNDESLDTVHVNEDFGEMTDELNEYLTSVRMTSQAFRVLTDYYAASSRPTVICMMGDHAPALMKDLKPDPGIDPVELEIRSRSVPYVIWANFDLNLPEQTDYVMATDLFPLLLSGAGLPTSAYHNYILSLRKELPVRTANGYFRDANGAVGRLEDSPFYDRVLLYYYLEYNAIHHGSDYRKELFTCPASVS